MSKNGISNEEALKIVLSTPSVVSFNLEERFKEIQFIFDLYLKFDF